MMSHANYFDHNATTPLHPELCVELPRLYAEDGNPSSLHSFGRAARRQLEAQMSMRGMRPAMRVISKQETLAA